MARRPTKPDPEPPILSLPEKQAAIQRFNARIAELQAFDVEGMQEEHPTELSNLSASIQRALEKAFGASTNDYKRFRSADALFYHSMIMMTQALGN